MDIGTASAVIGGMFATAVTIIGVVRTLYAPKIQASTEPAWKDDLHATEQRLYKDIDIVRERVHGVELNISEIKHLTAYLQEIKDMIVKLENKESADIVRLEAKIQDLSTLVLQSLKDRA